MVSYIRARKDEQKAERRQAILAAGRVLFAARPFADIAMSEVAERAKLAQGTLYLYFRTQEELFLALVDEELGAWLGRVDARLARLRVPTPARVAALLAEEVSAAPALQALLSLLHAVLEQNLEEAAARAWKASLCAGMAPVAARLEAALPALGAGGGTRLLLTLHALVVGLAQMARPSPVIARVLADPALAPLRVDFDPALHHALAALVEGLCARGSHKRRTP